jgi:hypothetical protein
MHQLVQRTHVARRLNEQSKVIAKRAFDASSFIFAISEQNVTHH